MTENAFLLILRAELKNFATKDDLKVFATKKDLEAFPTRQELKDELKAFATKEDLKAFPNKRDVKEIVRAETADIRNEQLRQGVLLEKLDNDVEKLAELVSHDLKHTPRVHDHDKRITTLEGKSKIVVSTVTHHSAEIKVLQAAQNQHFR